MLSLSHKNDIILNNITVKVCIRNVWEAAVKINQQLNSHIHLTHVLPYSVISQGRSITTNNIYWSLTDSATVEKSSHSTYHGSYPASKKYIYIYILCVCMSVCFMWHQRRWHAREHLVPLLPPPPPSKWPLAYPGDAWRPTVCSGVHWVGKGEPTVKEDKSLSLRRNVASCWRDNSGRDSGGVAAAPPPSRQAPPPPDWTQSQRIATSHGRRRLFRECFVGG